MFYLRGDSTELRLSLLRIATVDILDFNCRHVSMYSHVVKVLEPLLVFVVCVVFD